MIHRIGFTHNENLKDIKTAKSLSHAVLLHIQKCRAKNTPLLRISYRLRRCTEPRRTACLDLDKKQRASILGDDVDLACLSAKLPLQYAAAAFLQILRRQIFASIAKTLRRHLGSSGF